MKTISRMDEMLDRKNEFHKNSQSDIKEKTSKILSIIYRKKFSLAIWCLLVFVSSAIYMKITPSTYTAITSLILEPRKQGATSPESQASVNNAILDGPQADSQIQVIRSERLLSAVFNTLQLGDIDEFKYGNPTLIENFVSYFGLKRKRLDFEQLDQNIKNTIAFNNFSSRINVRRIANSYVVELSIYSINPETAARLANSIAMQYIKQQIELKAAFYQSAPEYLQGRIARFQTQLDIAGNAVKLGTIPDAVLPDADAKVIGAAAIPLVRSSPQKSIVGAFAFIVGPLSGVVFVMILGLFDTNLRDEQHLRTFSNLECLTCLSKNSLNHKSSQIRVKSLIYNEQYTKEESLLKSSIHEIKSFLLSIPDWADSQPLGIVCLPDKNTNLDLPLIISDAIANEGKGALLIESYSCVSSDNKTDKKINRHAEKQNSALSEDKFFSNDHGISKSKTNDLTIVRLGDIVDKYHDDQSLDSVMTESIINYGSKKIILVDIFSIGDMKKVRTSLSKFKGVIVVVDSTCSKESDWNFTENRLKEMNIRILATVLIKK